MLRAALSCSELGGGLDRPSTLNEYDNVDIAGIHVAGVAVDVGVTLF